METNTTTLADYLFTRLRQLGVDSIFGLPGDYNLNLLDYVEPAHLHWIGNCNELNAGYAADGYARIKGLGALVTTFGVGELSAINAIAGAYAERAPVVHVVGTPVRDSQDSRSLIHHTFNDGEYQRFDRMYEHVTVAQTMISDLRAAPGEIDRVLLQCLLHSRPVRITIPDDMVALRVPTRSLDTKISVPLPARQPKVEEEALAVVLDRIYAAKRPMILIDGESRQSKILDEVEHLVRTTEWPTFTTGFGKSLIDETLPNVYGVFTPAHKPFVDACDLVLSFGPHPSNTNTYIFQTIPPAATTVAFAATTVSLDKQTFRDLPAKLFLPQLIAQLDSAKIPSYKPDLPHPTTTLAAPSALPPTDKVNNASFWKKLSPFFREGDVILAETGTAGYGANEFILPPRTRLFKPVTWLSIGYMLPAALGASLAQRDRAAHGSEPHKAGRTVLLIGDGSFQLTAQELATIIHHKLDVVVFLINNAGYTIERCIHGHNARYNDITPWRYLKALELFGAPTEGEYAAHAWTVRTWADLEGVLADERMAKGKGVRMVEVVMEMLDAPQVLLNLLQEQFQPEKSEA